MADNPSLRFTILERQPPALELRRPPARWPLETGSLFDVEPGVVPAAVPAGSAPSGAAWSRQDMFSRETGPTANMVRKAHDILAGVLFDSVAASPRPLVPDAQAKMERGWMAKLLEVEDYDAAFLLVRVVSDLQNLWVSARQTDAGVTAFLSKIRDLASMAPASGEKIAVELEISSFLARGFDCFAIDPLAGGDAGSPTATPDFFFRLPNGTGVYGDATCFEFSFLKERENIAREMERRFRARTGPTFRDVSVTLPLLVSAAHDLPRLTDKKIVNDVVAEPQGERTVNVAGGDAAIRWQPIYLKDAPTDGPVRYVGPGLGLRSPNDSAFGWSVHLAEPTQHEAAEVSRRVMNAVASKIKDKKRQFAEVPTDNAKVLAFHCLQTEIDVNWPSILGSLFAKPDRRWLDAVLVYDRPTADVHRQRLTVLVNPDSAFSERVSNIAEMWEKGWQSRPRKRF